MSSRPPMFAAKVIRILTRSAAAQELGPNVCWMLSVIVGQEDSPAVRYSRPVTYYFEQLMPLCGFRSPKQLRAAITKAVETGWLEYTPGAKGRPGRFRVQIPDELADVEPYGCDESDPPANGRPDEKCVSESEANRAPKTKCVSESEVEAEMKRAPKRKRKGNPFLPVPNPIPKQEAASASDAVPDEALSWITWWNRLKAEGLVHAKVSVNPSRGVVTGVKRLRGSKELRELLSDRDRVERAIRQSDFVRGSWFTLPKLLGGTNKEGDYVAAKLLSGGYEQSNGFAASNGYPPPSSSSVPDRRPVTLAELKAQGERPS